MEEADLANISQTDSNNTYTTPHINTPQPYTNLVELQILLHVAGRPLNPSSITT
jgi:hypothetical protein